MTVTLAPTAGHTPTERAFIGEILDNIDPCRYLFTVINHPNGGARTYHSWTAGGPQVGDDIDHLAAQQGRDVYDWVEFMTRYQTRIDRGRHYVLSVDLRPLYDDLRRGVPSADTDRRAGLDKFAAIVARETGTTVAAARVLPWVGFGPRLLATR